MSDSRTRSRADRRRAKDEPPAEKRPLGPELKVVETQVFRGPNYWSYDPAIRLAMSRTCSTTSPTAIVRRMCFGYVVSGFSRTGRLRP